MAEVMQWLEKAHKRACIGKDLAKEGKNTVPWFELVINALDAAMVDLSILQETQEG